jgi:hypothetical protein
VEKPLSLEHWIDSLNTVLLVASAIELAGAAGAGSTGGAGSAAKPAAPVKPGVGGSIREQLLGKVSNEKLRNCINEMYRPGATIGDGGLADAIRYEITTGELIGGKSHIQKGFERMKNLENIIEKQGLNPGDLEIAQHLLDDLKSALDMGGQS